MHAKKILIGFVVILLLFAGVFLLVGSSGNPVSADIALDRIVLAGEPSGHGQMTVSFTREGPDYRFINIAADLNQDGTIAAYGEQPEWLVQNMDVSVAPREARSRYAVTLNDPAVADRSDIPAVIVVSTSPLQNWDGMLGREVGREAVISGVGERDREAQVMRDPEGVLLTRGVSTSPETAYAAAEPMSGTTTQDNPDTTGYYSAEHHGVADTPQEINECAPTAGTNAVEWLAGEYGIEDQMPEDTDATIDELKGDMDWDMGVDPGDSLSGLQNFIARRGLPFEAHGISGDTENLHRAMYEEMAQGQILLVGIQFWEMQEDGTEKKSGGHLATVTRIAGGDQYHPASFITLHDSGDGGATPEQDVYQMDGNEIEHMGGENERAEITSVIAVSPILDEAGSLVFPESGVSMDGETGMQGPTEGVSRLAFFTTTVDPVGDHFVGETFPVRAQVQKTGESQWFFYAGESFNVEADGPWTVQGRFSAGGPLDPPERQDTPPLTSIGEGTTTYTVSTSFTCTDEGTASVTFHPTLTWIRGGQEVIPPMIGGRFGEQLQPTDTLHVTSPPFSCLLTDAMIAEQDSQTALERLENFCPGVDTNVEDGQQIGVYLGPGDECYPDFQFRVAGPDACEQDHYHARNANTVISLTGASWADPNPPACGYGVEGSLEHEMVIVSQETLTMYLGDAFLGE